jgi:hypothetical protein
VSPNTPRGSPLPVHPLSTIPGKLAAPAFAPDGTAVVYDRNAPPKPTTRVDGVLWHHCRFCEHAANHKGHIKRHEAAHLGDKAFECQYCDDTFTEMCNLIDHERTHTGERPFECQYCDDTFTRRCTLVDHERTHTGERPHGCGECGARFTKRCHLVKHQRTHTGIKPYLCSACDYAAATSSGVTRHIKRRHPGSGAVAINATGVLEGPDNEGAVIRKAPAAATTAAAVATATEDKPSTTPAARLSRRPAVKAAAPKTVGPTEVPTVAAAPPHTADDAPGLPAPEPYVRGSLLRLLHSSPEQQALLLATDEYKHRDMGRYIRDEEEEEMGLAPGTTIGAPAPTATRKGGKG